MSTPNPLAGPTIPQGIDATKKEDPKLFVKKMHTDAKLPTRGTEDAAAIDLYSAGDWVLLPGQVTAIATGIAVQLPTGHVGLLCDRSGLASRGITLRIGQAEQRKWLDETEEPHYDMQVVGGVIDPDYRGEIRALLLNTTNNPVQIKKGDRVCQMIILPTSRPNVLECKAFQITEGTLTETKRGEGGLGSTGR